MREILLNITFAGSDRNVCFGPVRLSIDASGGPLLQGLEIALQILCGSRLPLPANIICGAFVGGFAVPLLAFGVLLPDDDLVVHLSVPSDYFKHACFGAAKSALAHGVSACAAKSLLGPVTLIGTTILLDYTKDGKVSWKTLAKCAGLTAVYVAVPVAGPLSLVASLALSAGVEVLCECTVDLESAGVEVQCDCTVGLKRGGEGGRDGVALY